MNTKIKEHEIPKSTNFAGGRGHGNNPGLGRETFIDELIAWGDSCTGTLFQRSSLRRGIYILPRLESSVSTVEKLIEVSTHTSKKWPPKDKGSVVGVRNPEDFFWIKRQEVTKKDWLDYRQRL